MTADDTQFGGGERYMWRGFLSSSAQMEEVQLLL